MGSELGFRAVNRALERVEEAGIQDRFAPLAESLMWLVMINDALWEEDEAAYRAHRDADEDGRLLEGLRYARHRLVHAIRVYGMHGVLDRGYWGWSTWGRSMFGRSPAWKWRRVDDLDDAVDKTGEPVYRSRLEGRDVVPTLHAAFQYLEKYLAQWSPRD